MEPGSPQREFRPVLLSRRGEFTAWGLALLVGGALLIMVLSGTPVISAVPILGGFLLFAALSISLGNWMDRRTVLQLDDSGIFYTNGLRRTRMAWDEISQVRVITSNLGKKVQVIGDRSYFGFRTAGVVRIQGEVKGQLGFEAGEVILSEIIERSGLQAGDRSGKDEYYSRR